MIGKNQPLLDRIEFDTYATISSLFHLLREVKNMKKNDEFEIEITDLSTDGEGIGHADGMTFFVKDTVPGDVILAGVTKLKKTYGYARVIRVLKASPDRVSPACPIAMRCGGCNLQHISYEAQLRFKEKKVLDALTRIGGIEAQRIDLEPIIGMDDPFNYRNKGQFPVGTDKAGNVICGFYATHSHDIVNTEHCMLQHDITDELMTAVREYMNECGVGAYIEAGDGSDTGSDIWIKETGDKVRTGKNRRSDKDKTNNKKKHTDNEEGIVRHILTRVGFTTHEVMLCVVIAADKLPFADRLVSLATEAVERYNAAHDSDYCLNSISYNINKENTNVILGDKVVTIAGLPFITDYIGDLQFRISPLSFYQVNPVQTEELYATALEFASSDENDTVWDLYCGIGTISLYFAKHVKKVYGIEIVPQAIEDAKENAKLNGITNAEFYCGAAEELFPKLMGDLSSGESSGLLNENESLDESFDEKHSRAGKPDIVVVDPPRKGCDAALIDCIGNMSPKKIVYVSCDPATLARDIKLLGEFGYEPVRVRPCDMFPQSTHVETVCLLSNRKNIIINKL